MTEQLELDLERNPSWYQMKAIEAYLCAVLSDNGLIIVKEQYYKTPEIIYYDNFHLFNTACWVGNWEVVHFLLEKGADKALKENEFKHDFENLKKLRPDIYTQVYAYINSKHLYNTLQSELEMHSSHGEITKI